MSEHLPDCIEHRAGLPFGCICDRLRAAERRGREDAVAAARGEQA